MVWNSPVYWMETKKKTLISFIRTTTNDEGTRVRVHPARTKELVNSPPNVDKLVSNPFLIFIIIKVKKKAHFLTQKPVVILFQNARNRPNKRGSGQQRLLQNQE